jgi:soluble lytic murein transglycosylase
VLARAAYWRGRAFEAAGQFDEMKAQYEAAARYPTAYYGQLARGRLGVSEIALRSPQPQVMEGVRSELLQAADMLYAIGEFDLLLSFVSDLAETSSDVATLSALGELTARHNDAQAMLAIGKPWSGMRFLRSEYRPIAQSLPQSISAWSIRLCAPRAPLTSATLRLPMRSG